MQVCYQLRKESFLSKEKMDYQGYSLYHKMDEF